MKTFIQWSAVSVVLYAVSSLGLHLYYSKNPSQVFVGVDSSFGMKAKWPMVKSHLKQISKEGVYVKYALSTDKNTVHSWADKLSLGTTLTYGPSKIDNFLSDKYSGLTSDADKLILITNSSNNTQKFQSLGWDIVRL